MILISNKICPFAERVWLALEHMRVQYKLQIVSLSDKPPLLKDNYQKAIAKDPSSTGKVPVLLDPNAPLPLAESDLIVWYLAQKYPCQNTLLPQDHVERLKMRHFINRYSSELLSVFYGFAKFSTKSEQQKEKTLEKMHKFMGNLNEDLCLPFAMGSQPTIADVIIFPFLRRWIVIEHYYKIEIDSKYEKVKEYLKQMNSLKASQTTRQQNDFFITGYSKYFQQ